jgi:hypothetical protein
MDRKHEWLCRDFSCQKQERAEVLAELLSGSPYSPFVSPSAVAAASVR